MGFLYLLHFERPLDNQRHPNRHYLGYTPRAVAKRVERHRQGRAGVTFTRVAFERDIGFELVREWKGASQADERRIKRQHNLPRFCPRCTAEPADVVMGSQPLVRARRGAKGATVDTGKGGDDIGAYIDAAAIEFGIETSTARAVSAAELAGEPIGPVLLTLPPHEHTLACEHPELAEPGVICDDEPFDDEPPERPDDSDVPMQHELADDERYPWASFDELEGLPF